MFEEALPSTLEVVESMEQCPFAGRDAATLLDADEANFVTKSTDSTKMHVPFGFPFASLGTLLILDIQVVAVTSEVVWYAIPMEAVVWVQRNCPLP